MPSHKKWLNVCIYLRQFLTLKCPGCGSSMTPLLRLCLPLISGAALASHCIIIQTLNPVYSAQK